MRNLILLFITMSFFSVNTVNAQSIFDNLIPSSNVPGLSSGGYYVSCDASVDALTGCAAGDALANGLKKWDSYPALNCSNSSITSAFGGGTFVSNLGQHITPRWGSWTSASNGVTYTVQNTLMQCENETSAYPSGVLLGTGRDVWAAPMVQGGCASDEIEFNNACYSAIAVEQADTCTPSNDYLPATTSDASVCVTKSDGSMCHYTKSSSNGSDYYAQSLEPSSCYNDEYPDFTDTATAPTGYDCQDIGNGVTACPESPENVCNSQGTCDTGCGNVSFNGQSHFMCFSQDTDLDGLGDYADPDIDGDGLANNLDLDADGDGNDDPDYSTSASQSSGVSSVPTSEEIGDSIADRLIEQSDFNISSALNDANTAMTDTDTAVTDLLNDPNFDFKSSVSNTNYDTSINALTSTIAPTACVNNFQIPFTGTQLDICSAANKTKPFLFFIFAFSTIYYCYMRINSTARGV